jgi:hypothetical protein
LSGTKPLTRNKAMRGTRKESKTRVVAGGRVVV